MITVAEDPRGKLPTEFSICASFYRFEFFNTFGTVQNTNLKQVIFKTPCAGCLKKIAVCLLYNIVMNWEALHNLQI